MPGKKLHLSGLSLGATSENLCKLGLMLEMVTKGLSIQSYIIQVYETTHPLQP